MAEKSSSSSSGIGVLGLLGNTFYKITMETYKKFENSSWVNSIGIDLEQKVMTVEPKTGHNLVYNDFPVELWEEALKAESIGKFIHGVVKPLYNKKPDEIVAPK